MTATESTIEIDVFTGSATRTCRAGLVELLIDAIHAGASVGFLEPLAIDEAGRYWDKVFAEVESGDRVLLVAKEEGRIVGAVQLVLPSLPNARHRAEAQKLLVHTSARRRGLGTALMAEVEARAMALGRYLIILDTRAGDPAGKLYEQLGYSRAAVIPGYAQSPNGKMHAAAFYYRDLRDCDVLGER